MSSKGFMQASAPEPQAKPEQDGQGVSHVVINTRQVMDLGEELPPFLFWKGIYGRQETMGVVP